MFSWKTTAFLAAILMGCTSVKDSTSNETGISQNNDSAANSDLDSAVEEPSAIIWTGPTLTFTKEDFADHTDASNQDAITDQVILTRTFQGSLINVVLEDAPSSSTPSGTAWAMGSTDSIDDLEFKNLKAAANQSMKDAVGIPFVLQLIEENIYIDVTFLSWSPGGSAGGFGYERSTQN